MMAKSVRVLASLTQASKVKADKAPIPKELLLSFLKLFLMLLVAYFFGDAFGHFPYP